MTAAAPGIEPPPPVVPALAEPVEPPGKRWISAISLANLGLFTAWFGPILTLLPLQAERFAPDGKESVLAWVLGIGAFCSMVSNPLFGAISDRTTSRFGRRIPWTVLGAAGGVLSLLLLAVAQNVAVLIVGWCLAQITLNANFAAITAAVPDQTPHRQRGTVGGWLGIAQTFGTVVGAGLAALMGGIVGGYLACAAVLVLLTVPYVLLRRDEPIDAADRPPWQWRAFLRGFWISPREYPDFAWAWFTRFLMNLGFSIGIVYLLYFLKDAVHYDDPEGGVFVLNAVMSGTLLVTVLVSGVLSDRLNRRRVFVFASGVSMAVAVLMLAGWQTWTGAIVAAAVLGLGYGVFVSVDLALMIDVLPAAADRGKDLGLINIANSLPQVLAPVLAAPLVVHLGGYRTLFVFAALVVLAGAVLVFRIKYVR